MNKQACGTKAESLARSWLEHHGYQFLQSNFYRRVGELDLIMRDPDQQTIVFVEVRFRQSAQYGDGVASVNYAKQRKLIKTANAWLQKHATDRTHARIDVIGIRPLTAESKPTENAWQGYDMTWIINAIED